MSRFLHEGMRRVAIMQAIGYEAAQLAEGAGDANQRERKVAGLITLAAFNRLPLEIIEDAVSLRAWTGRPSERAYRRVREGIGDFVADTRASERPDMSGVVPNLWDSFSDKGFVTARYVDGFDEPLEIQPIQGRTFTFNHMRHSPGNFGWTRGIVSINDPDVRIEEGDSASWPARGIGVNSYKFERRRGRDKTALRYIPRDGYI
jgi:hypothetical protein